MVIECLGYESSTDQHCHKTDMMK